MSPCREVSSKGEASLARQTKGHKWFAALYPLLISPEERRRWSKVRPRIMGEVEGRVLEIGVGSGFSLRFYPVKADVVATEPDPHMLKRAQRHLEELGATNIGLQQAPAEDLPFENESFDHVVSSWVLCTVRDLSSALAEAQRVLKPEGTFRFMEHVRNDESRFWSTVQDLTTPAFRWFGAGCHPNRRIKQAIEEAGFRIEWLEDVRGWLQPVIYGVARPS